MDARALVCNEQQNFDLRQVILPDGGANHVAVLARYTGVSIGTEFSLIRNKLSWGPYPICTGYQGVGVIERVGRDVRGFAAGQRVYYRHNRVMRLADGGDVSAVSGVHCSRAVIDMSNDPQLARLPEGVAEDAASLFVMPAVALCGVDMAGPRMGDVVVVQGVGLIGLGVVAMAGLRGCVVVAVDIRADRLAIAGKLGADHVIRADEQDVEAELKRIAPDGADVVFECTGLPACLDQAVALCRRHGTMVWQGNYGAEPVSLHFLPAHGRRLRMLFPCDDGGAACRRAVLKQMAGGSLRWDATVTHRIPPEQAPELYGRINSGRAADVIGAVIDWT